MMNHITARDHWHDDVQLQTVSHIASDSELDDGTVATPAQPFSAPRLRLAAPLHSTRTLASTRVPGINTGYPVGYPGTRGWTPGMPLSVPAIVPRANVQLEQCSLRQYPGNRSNCR
eukprot:208203-Rhodomonas_salina.1